MKKLISTVLTAALVLGMSVTALADETDEYNEYGMSYVAIDMLTHTMKENNAKYNVVDELWDEGHSPVITYANGFQVVYSYCEPDLEAEGVVYSYWGIDLVAEGDEDGKKLFKYYDASLTTTEQVAQTLVANGYIFLYDYIDNMYIPAGACYVNTKYGTVDINATTMIFAVNVPGKPVR